MKFIRNPWFIMGTAALGLLIAACSSKNEEKDSAVGGSPNPSTNLGGTDGTGGSRAANTTRATGGKAPTDTSAGDTGGVYIRPATGGASSFDPETYCNGIFKGKTCSSTQVSADIRVVNMLLVLDESGSMNDAPAAGAASKWSIMSQALTTALTKVEDDINFGLLLYPYKDGGIHGDSMSELCAIPDTGATAVNIPIGAGGSGVATVQQILDKVNSQTPAGGTPTATALKRALDYFVNGDGKFLSGSRWVLLATDGGPNCNPVLSCPKETCTQNMDCKCGSGCTTTVNCCEASGANNYGYICLDTDATTGAIRDLAAIGVKTFVIGIPGSEAYASSLNQFADAGKMPNTGANGERFYPVSAASALTDLTQAFETITSKLVTSCDIELSETPKVSVDKINVAIDCELQTPLQSGVSPDASGADGFYIDDSYSPNPAHLKLVGTPCSRLSTTGANKVDVIVGCQSIN